MTRLKHPLIEGETREDRAKRLRRDYYLANREHLLAKQAQYNASPAGRAADRRKTAKIMALAKAIVADIEVTPEADRPRLVQALVHLGQSVLSTAVGFQAIVAE